LLIFAGELCSFFPLCAQSKTFIIVFRSPSECRPQHETRWFFNSLLGDSREVEFSLRTGQEKDIVLFDAITEGESLLTALDPEKIKLLDMLASRPLDFVPPIVNLMPAEAQKSWPEVERSVHEGREFEVWRNRIHWLSEGRSPDEFKRIVDRIQGSLAGVLVNVPGRTREQHPKVALTYQDDGERFDVSEGGAGLRTLLGLVVTVELSKAPILLLDEPDSHLHSSVQRQVAEFLSGAAESGKQIIIATHAPDMIEEFPLECLRWVDRRETQARPASNVSQALVQLGAATRRQALQLLDAILYFEDKPDERVLRGLMTRCGKHGLLARSTTALLRGAGDATHLPQVARFIEAHHNRKIPMAVLLDADYQRPCAPEIQGLVITVRLPAKELENLLLLQPGAIAGRARNAFEQRLQRTSSVGEGPTEEEIANLIDEATRISEISGRVKYNWVANHLPDRKPDAGDLQKLDEEFSALWNDVEFRRRYCPGKEVLRQVKKSLQDRYQVSFATESVFAFYDPDSQTRDLFDRIEQHVMEALK
jgi:AAA domain, putative AbiEii toxin, Type IV TA system